MIEIRKATNLDIPSIMEIENFSFVSKWKDEDIKKEINENKFATLNVISVDNKVVGFLDYWITFDSATICQIAIHPNFRKQHLGDKLIVDFFDDCFAKRVTNITLEVRNSNQIAINFYKKHGFIIELIKPHYYSNGEDALYMVKKVNINA